MNKGNKVTIVSSDEPYHIGQEGVIIQIINQNVRVELETGKIVEYHASSLEVQKDIPCKIFVNN
jgi:RNase P/RNase MRP subunit p29